MGVNVVYDAVGGDYAEAALRAIAWKGRFLVVGMGKLATRELSRVRVLARRRRDGIEAVLERESARCSAYRMTLRDRRISIRFMPKADRDDKAVALASMAAKYTRELSMRAFNEFFGELQDDLKPTAGYTTDGRRWLADAQQAVARAALDPDLLIRRR